MTDEKLSLKDVQEKHSDVSEYYKHEIKRRDNVISKLRGEIGRWESYSTLIADAIKGLPPVRSKPIKYGKKGDATHDVTLYLADLHAEEVVDEEEMGGYAAYNWDVFLDRMWHTLLTTVDLTQLFRSASPVNVLHINIMGDVLSGKIHDELERTNGWALPDAVPRVAYVLAQFIMQISAYFEKVIITGVVGNHGREDKKMPSKQAVVRNWDYAVYQIASNFTKKSNKVIWRIPKSTAVIVECLGYKALIKHGNGIRSQGVTPYYGISREFGKEREKRRGKEDFDILCLAHYHHYGVVNGNTYICPSMIGPGQFSFDTVHSSYPAEQLLMFSTDYKDLGITDCKLIKYLNTGKHGFTV